MKESHRKSDGKKLSKQTAEDPKKDDELALLAKAIGHPVRIRIIRLLSQRTSCVCGDIVDVLPLAQSTVSQHLKVLKKAGLIKGTIKGPKTCYCLEPNRLDRFRELLTTL